MLEYAKLVLKGVSFDKTLFEKELYKLSKGLKSSEVYEFQRWCYENFGRSHLPILNQCFGETGKSRTMEA